MSMINCLARLIFMSTAFLAHQSNADPILKISPIDSFERERPTVKISGAYLAGVVFSNGVPTSDKPSLRARVPKSWAAQKVCVRGKSRDGIYESKYEYLIPASWNKSAVIDFEYPTSYAERVESANSIDLGISIQKGGCSSDDPVYLVGYWNAKDQAATSNILLLLNSVSADEAFIFIGSDPAADQVNCVRLEINQSKGFDFQCILPANQLVGQNVEIEMNTSSSGVRDPATIVSIELR